MLLAFLVRSMHKSSIMKISKIEIQKKNKRRFNLYIEDAYLFSVSEDTLVHFHLQKGKSCSNADLEAIQAYEGRMRCVSQAYRYLARRPHLISELQLKLHQKEFGASVIDATIKTLKEKKYLDDADFIRRFITDEIRLKQTGPLKIRQKLLQKGAPAEVTDRQLSELYPFELQLKNARIQYDKRNQRSDTPDKQKLIRYLQQKGFTWEIINQVAIG